MKTMNTMEMKDVYAGSGTYVATCTMCPQQYSTSYIGVYGGLSWSTAKVLCEGKLRNHMIEVHYADL